jgi:hypothetical protein
LDGNRTASRFGLNLAATLSGIPAICGRPFRLLAREHPIRHERSTSDAPPTFGAACGYSRDIRRSLAGILPFDTTRRHNQMLVCRVEPFKSKQINGRRVRYSFISWCVTSQFHATISSCVARECGGRGAGFRRSCMSEKFDP